MRNKDKTPKRVDNNPPTPVRLQPELKERIKAQAEKENRTISGMIIHMILEYFKRLKNPNP